MKSIYAACCPIAQKAGATFYHSPLSLIIQGCRAVTHRAQNLFPRSRSQPYPRTLHSLRQRTSHGLLTEAAPVPKNLTFSYTARVRAGWKWHIQYAHKCRSSFSGRLETQPRGYAGKPHQNHEGPPKEKTACCKRVTQGCWEMLLAERSKIGVQCRSGAPERLKSRGMVL